MKYRTTVIGTNKKQLEDKALDEAARALEVEPQDLIVRPTYTIRKHFQGSEPSGLLTADIIVEPKSP